MVSIFKFTALLSLGLLSSCGKDGLAPSNGCGKCRIFVTASAYSGALGGPVGADAKCMTDANKPADGTYKAAITDFTNRGFDMAGWVYLANTKYFRADGTTLIATTNALKQLTPLVAAISSSSSNVWTGGDPRHCGLWASAGGGDLGNYGDSGSTTLGGFANSQACNLTARLYCVEQ